MVLLHIAVAWLMKTCGIIFTRISQTYRSVFWQKFARQHLWQKFGRQPAASAEGWGGALSGVSLPWFPATGCWHNMLWSKCQITYSSIKLSKQQDCPYLVSSCRPFMLRLCVAGVGVSWSLVDVQLILRGCPGATAPQNDLSVSPSEVDKVHCVRTRGGGSLFPWGV